MTRLDQPLSAFDDTIVERLFAAILAHDDIYADAALPPVLPLAEDSEELERCFHLVARMFVTMESAERAATFLPLLARDPQAAAARIEELKMPRARFKHSQFTMHMCDARHRYPRLLHGATVLMGEIQDALKHDQPGRAQRLGRLLSLMLSAPGRWRIGQELASFRISSMEDYRRHLGQQVEVISAALSQPMITGQRFHETRKVISRLMAHYDNLTILNPTPDRVAAARFISSINGLMGGYHDGLVRDKMEGRLDYARDQFAIPDQHLAMLESLVKSFSAIP